MSCSGMLPYGSYRSRRRDNLKSYIALIGCALLRRRNVSPVKYELVYHIPEDGFLQVTALETSNLT
jgi:hypothetical protein